MYSFEERFQKLSNLELIQILNHSGDYQDEAVACATMLLDSRKLSDEEKRTIREELVILEKEKKSKEKKSSVTTKKDMLFDADILDVEGSDHNPYEFNRVLVIIIIALLGPLSLYSLVVQIVFMFNEFSTMPIEYKFAEVRYLFQLFIVPAATLLFWFRKKMGWAAVFMVFWYNFLSSSIQVIVLWEYIFTDARDNNLFYFAPSYFTVYAVIPISLAATVFMLRKSFLSYFGVSRRLAWLLFALVPVIVIFMISMAS